MASGFDNVDDAVCPPQRLKLVSATPQDASTENQGNSTWWLLTRWNTSERYVCTRSMKVTSNEYNKLNFSNSRFLKIPLFLHQIFFPLDLTSLQF